jgi:hypothetical protein
MDSTINIVADNLDGFIERISRDVASGMSLHNYHVACQLGKHRLKLDISKSPGGGVEGGYGTTSVTAPVVEGTDFHFVLYPEDFLISIGKLFGLQDVVLGYPEFDDKLIVKTNNAARLKSILVGDGARKILYNMSGFSLKLESHDEGHSLELSIQRALTNVGELNEALAMFYEVLTQVEASV